MGRLRTLLTHRRMPLVVALVAAAVLWTPLLRRDDGVGEATMEEAAALVGRPGALVLDANVRELYELAHLPGALHVSPLTLSAEELGRWSGAAGRDATLLFYCKNPH